jgi:hypothetical protein
MNSQLPKSFNLIFYFVPIISKLLPQLLLILGSHLSEYLFKPL